MVLSLGSRGSTKVTTGSYQFSCLRIGPGTTRIPIPPITRSQDKSRRVETRRDETGRDRTRRDRTRQDKTSYTFMYIYIHICKNTYNIQSRIHTQKTIPYNQILHATENEPQVAFCPRRAPLPQMTTKQQPDPSNDPRRPLPR